MGNVFDIIICPECHGEKTFVSGQVMKDAKIYLIKEACPKCKGHGKIGLERKENINDESQMFFDLSDLASENESAPIDYIAHYRLHYRDSILKYLKRLVWQKTKTEEPKPDADNAEKPAEMD